MEIAKYQEIISKSEAHNVKFKYNKKKDIFYIIYQCPEYPQYKKIKLQCPTAPHAFSYYCVHCGTWLCEKNLYKQ